MADEEGECKEECKEECKDECSDEKVALVDMWREIADEDERNWCVDMCI